MSNTTVFILCVAVPLLLGGFANYFAHKAWILYLPLFGVLLLLGYLGHLAIQFYANPQNDLENGDKNLKPDGVTQERPNISITSQGQSGGFTGINRGTLNLGPSPRVISVERRQQFLGSSRDAPKGNITVRFVADNDESHNFAMQIRSLLNEAGYNVTPGVWPVVHFGTPVNGVQLEVRDKDNPPNFAKVLQPLLEEIGIEALGAPGSTDQAQDEVVVYVGLRPPGDDTTAR
jgi:hypothetical protein